MNKQSKFSIDLTFHNKMLEQATAESTAAVQQATPPGQPTEHFPSQITVIIGREANAVIVAAQHMTIPKEANDNLPKSPPPASPGVAANDNNKKAALRSKSIYGKSWLDSTKRLAAATMIGGAVATAVIVAVPEKAKDVIQALRAANENNEKVALLSKLAHGKASSHIDGLDSKFAKQLAALFAAMPSEVRRGTKILSGYRSIEHQRRLFEAAIIKYGSEAKARQWVAPPGKSMHQRGLAVDLQYGSRRAREWIHANASKFGLFFPLDREDWHIESIDGRKRAALGEVTPRRPQRHFAGNVEDAIRRAAQSSGLDVGMLWAFAGIESGGDPNAVTGSYHGLLQLSQAEFAELGGKNIYDPYDNARIAAIKLKREADQFTRTFGREPTPFDMYMVHQRGLAGYEQHLNKPDALAWTALYNTGEGRQRGEGWARKTITQNLPRAVLERMGGVDRITNRQFIEWWRGRFEREAGGGPPLYGAK